ncbi:MAG: hypothetical protein HY555_05485 [Euryarchaeota archaeon]|nr:hypothetical protein [Euryarchaeota archaeon]
MIDIFKQNKILLGVIIVIVLVGAFRLFIYDSYRMPDAVSPGTAAISDGSTLTLDIPDSALPSGVTKNQIAVEPIPVSELPENLRWLDLSYAFRLEPDGLEFSGPIPFTLQIPTSKDGTIPIFLQVDGSGEIEALDNIVTEINENGEVFIHGAISHFSYVAIGWLGGFRVSMPESLGSHKVGESFTVPVTYAIEEGTGFKAIDVVLNPTNAGASGFTGESLFIADAPVVPKKIRGLPEWNTRMTSPRETVYATFWCIAGGSGFIEHTIYADYNLEVSIKYVSVYGPKVKSGIYQKIESPVECINQTTTEPKSPSPPPSPLEPPTTSPPTSTPTPTTTPTPTPKPSCNIPAFQACANTFSLQGCINACPYVSTTCPPGTPPGTDCKKIDQSCSDACWSTADRHVDRCLASNNCTKEEVIAGGGGARR